MICDEFYMRRALEFAKKGEGKTSPNPPVGCVIVKNNKIISEGYHKKAGLPHAEIEALKKTKDAGNSTMYVTLEPCDHYGKTPPCTNEIIKRGVKRVVIGMKDPHRVNNGRGIKKLKKNRIHVETGVCSREIEEFYKPYKKFITERTPFVTVKIAESLDGKIATSKGESRWISNDLSRRYVQKLRSKVDAVMIGINTVIKDGPSLIPKTQKREFTKRIVVDSHLRMPLDSKLVRSSDSAPLLIAAIDKASAKKINILRKKGATVLIVRSKNNRVDLTCFFRELGKLGIMHVLVEGGGELVGKLFDERLVNKILFFISPKIIGGESAVSSVRGKGVNRIRDAVRLKNMVLRRFREDILVEGDVCWNNRRSR